jgi:arylsulfatase A-like enzyme
MGESNRKNIILLTVDCLRADHLHCLGYSHSNTPTLDKLAKNGILYTNAFANGPFTSYSIPSFLTSNLPPVPVQTATIAEILQQLGYATAAFVPNPIIFSKTCGGTRVNQGFDTYDMMLSSRNQYRLTIEFARMAMMKYLRRSIDESRGVSQLIYHIYDRLIQTFPTILCPKNQEYIPRADTINNRAINWIKKQQKPFFLWLHYMDVHEPYAPIDYENHREMLYLITKYRDFPNKLTAEEIQKLIVLYDREIQYTDKAINHLLKQLKSYGYFDNSIIIVSADHGDAFNEHGTLGHGGKFKAQLYDEFLHIPLILHGLDQKGIVVDHQIQLLDLAPTICELTGAPVPPNFFGTSFLCPTAQGMIARSVWYTAYRTNQYKLIIPREENKPNELYDLQEDPFEKNNIYDQKPTLSKQIEHNMITLLSEYKKKTDVLNIRGKIPQSNQ